MDDDWTPNTAQVRVHVVVDPGDRQNRMRGKAFDRWLAAHDREVAAKTLEAAAAEAKRIETGTPWIDSDGESIHCDTVREDPVDWLVARARALRATPSTGSTGNQVGATG